MDATLIRARAWISTWINPTLGNWLPYISMLGQRCVNFVFFINYLAPLIFEGYNWFLDQKMCYGVSVVIFWTFWWKGLKTGMYYLRTRAAADAIKFTVDTSMLKVKFPAFSNSSFKLFVFTMVTLFFRGIIFPLFALLYDAETQASGWWSRRQNGTGCLLLG